MLSALASGIVSGVGNDSGHGICQTIRYGEYEVTSETCPMSSPNSDSV